MLSGFSWWCIKERGQKLFLGNSYKTVMLLMNYLDAVRTELLLIPMATSTHLPPCFHGWTSLSCSKYKPSLSLVLRSLPLSISSRAPYGSREPFLPLIVFPSLLGYYQRQTNLPYPLPLVDGTLNSHSPPAAHVSLFIFTANAMKILSILAASTSFLLFSFEPCPLRLFSSPFCRNSFC